MNVNENMEREKAKALAAAAAEALDSKKALDIKLLSVGSKTVLADWFVVATGTSSTHIRTLADETEFAVGEKLGIKPLRVEGFSDNAWTLIDYGSVVVHIFTAAARDFYKLEKLWEDAQAIAVDTQD